MPVEVSPPPNHDVWLMFVTIPTRMLMGYVPNSDERLWIFCRNAMQYRSSLRFNDVWPTGLFELCRSLAIVVCNADHGEPESCSTTNWLPCHPTYSNRWRRSRDCKLTLRFLLKTQLKLKYSWIRIYSLSTVLVSVPFTVEVQVKFQLKYKI